MTPPNRPLRPRPAGLLVSILFLLLSGAALFLAKRQTTPSRELFIYLTRPNQSSLDPHPVRLSRDVPEDQVREILGDLVEKSNSSPAEQRVVPAGTRLLNVSLRGGTATLNFNATIKETVFWQGSEHEYLCIHALVNTAAQVTGVKRVKILVEGQEVETFGGHVELTEPLEPDKKVSGHTAKALRETP